MSLLAHVRAVVRLVLCVLFTLVLLLIWGTGYVLCLGAERPAIAIRGWIVQHWSRGLARIIGMRRVVIGTPPEPPFCLVANHLSYIDVLVLHACTKGVLISRADVAKWPGIGFLARIAGTLFINRRRIRQIMDINEQIRAVLDRGDGVLFFPEGTSTAGDDVSRFRSPLLNYPAALSYPVHFAAIDYKSDSFDVRKHVCWWADMTFVDHLYTLLTKPGFQARVRFGNAPITESNRKELAARLEDKVRALYEPVRNTPPT
ncbi:MAG: 1-acyl-sn-glycerol-3-phosphate acyltransferase [Rhodothermales bacterium]|nr:1-acyl-sn-glycerol-3-phosphate acyltransferase [Rhodothermales bacterium]